MARGSELGDIGLGGRLEDGLRWSEMKEKKIVKDAWIVGDAW